MKLTTLTIENFKGLRDVTIPLSQFECLIGENNVGKSSVLQAIARFFSGKALQKIHYFDERKNVRIEIDLDEITDDDLNLLSEDQKTKIEGIIKEGQLTLVRIYGADGKSELKYRTLVPSDDRFKAANVTELVKGKKGQALLAAILERFPELSGDISASSTQGDVREKIQNLADNLPISQKIMDDVDLPTGIDKSIYPMLPELIYIPAVKDLEDDIKTSESTPFGKILGILLKAIEPQLSTERGLFEGLNAKLNRVVQPDGSVLDQRLDPVKKIEDAVQSFVQESFRAVKMRIEIPPPEFKTILSSAKIFADDGVDGPIETKGDGLRRATVFAVLRAYVELNKRGVISQPDVQTDRSRYLLLFEEPELYLHPKAQRILFDALGTFSQKHPVLVTTHSPAFFGPQSTTTFIKMHKKADPSVSDKPFGDARPIDLKDVNAKNQFQLICYENNNIAFFAETVVLVEGDSDYIVFPHLAKLLNPAWDCSQLPVCFARIGGKANVRRYREFFSKFGIRTFVITDLDFLLGDEFNQIDPSEDIRNKRAQLLAAADVAAQANGEQPALKTKQIKDAQQRDDLRTLWGRACEVQARFATQQAEWDELSSAVDSFFSWQKYWIRRDALCKSSDADVLAKKKNLIETLRTSGAFVLERGCIEDYYPEGVDGEGKPAKAQAFNNTITTKAQAAALSDPVQTDTEGREISEFEAVFTQIFQ